ncbi:MAG: transglycosylase SLT domain-containing protein [Gammaproteobacteria bacterium]
MAGRHFFRFAILATLAAFCWLPWPVSAYGVAPPGVAVPGSNVFPSPPELDEAVQFWRQVFGVWSRNQVALHDDEHLGLIYEIFHLPAPWSEGLTSEQAQLIRDRRERLENKLSAMEYRVRQGLPLDYEQQRLYDQIVKAGGKFAVFGAATRLRQQRGMQERFLTGLEISGRYDARMREVFRNARLPEDLAYLPHIESSFVNHARSNVGASGIWQFMRSTGVKYLMINDAVDERLDPVFAARGAARYLGDAYRRLGDWGVAITSYNHGVNGMAAATQEYGPDIGKIVRQYKGRLFGFASRNFYAEFLAVRSIIDDLDQYFPRGVRLDRPIDHARVRLMYPATLSQLAGHYGIGTGIVEVLNPSLSPRAATGRIALPAGTELWLPKHTVADPGGFAIYSRKMESLAPQRPHIPTSRQREPAKRVAVVSKAKSKSLVKVARPGSRMHVVRKGESPFRIAIRYGVQVKTMMAFNDLRPNAVIRPGQKLRIPTK